MWIMPLGGAFWWYRHRKSWAASSLEGALNDQTWQPWGLTPWKTPLMVPSLPPVSIAWSTISRLRRCSPYSRDWRSLMRSRCHFSSSLTSFLRW